MMVRGIASVALSCLLMAGCKSDSGVSYARDVAPILEQRCNVCHHAASRLGIDFSNPFDSETGIVRRPNTWFEPHMDAQGNEHQSDYEFIVDPFVPENSALVAKVREVSAYSDDEGNPMPYVLDALSEEELEDVEAWIAAGANDDETFEPVKDIFGRAISNGGQGGRCTFCHYPDAPNGLNVLDVFDPVEGMVGVESTFGGVIVDPGNPDGSVLMKRLRGDGVVQMPLTFPRLGEAEVQKIVDWIIAGAPNN